MEERKLQLCPRNPPDGSLRASSGGGCTSGNRALFSHLLTLFRVSIQREIFNEVSEDSLSVGCLFQCFSAYQSSWPNWLALRQSVSRMSSLSGVLWFSQHYRPAPEYCEDVQPGASAFILNRKWQICNNSEKINIMFELSCVSPTQKMSFLEVVGKSYWSSRNLITYSYLQVSDLILLSAIVAWMHVSSKMYNRFGLNIFFQRPALAENFQYAPFV